MTELITLQEPVECPFCMEAGRQGFLQKMLETEEATHFVNNTIDYRCGTCYALFEVKEDEL